MRKALLAFLFFLPFNALSQTAVLPVYDCIQGGVKAKTSGSPSINYLQGIVPYCNVTVYYNGTTNIAITSPQTPLTANSNGSIPPIYAAINQGYDIVLSGGIPPNVYTVPKTLTNLWPGTNLNAAYALLSGASFTGPVSTSGTFSAGSVTAQTKVQTPNIQVSGNPWYDVTAYGATGNTKVELPTFYNTGDGVSVSSSHTFTSASSPWICSQVVGHTITINGAGASGGVLTTTITACANSGSITLQSAAGTSGTGESFYDSNAGNAAASSTLFTDTVNAPFNCTTDVGKSIQIQNAGVSGAPLLTTIAACASASSVTLSNAASTTSSGQMYFFGTDDSTSFQNALNAAIATGGTVFVPAKNYLISSSPVLDNSSIRSSISITGTCSYMGRLVMAPYPANAPPIPTCSTIIDGSNNGTLQFIGTQNKTVSHLNFLSFPLSQGEFILMTGTSTQEVRDTAVFENSFWGKQYAIFGNGPGGQEDVHISRNGIGCAGVGAIVFNSGLQNKNVFDDNYIDYAGQCSALPVIGEQMTTNNGVLGPITNPTIVRNEIQNLTTPL